MVAVILPLRGSDIACGSDILFAPTAAAISLGGAVYHCEAIELAEGE